MADLLAQALTPGAGVAAVLGFAAGLAYDRTRTLLGRKRT